MSNTAVDETPPADELELTVQWLTVRNEFRQAKERVAAGELDRSSDEYRAIRDRKNAMLAFWRGIRSFVTSQRLAEFLESLPDDEARQRWLDTSGFSAGSAVATPDPCGVSAEAQETN